MLHIANRQGEVVFYYCHLLIVIIIAVAGVQANLLLCIWLPSLSLAELIISEIIMSYL